MRIQKTVKPLEGPVGDNGSGWHNAARLESCVRDGRSGMSSVVDVEGIATCTGAIDAFTRGLAVDLAPIRVNSVFPGLVDTEVNISPFFVSMH